MPFFETSSNEQSDVLPGENAPAFSPLFLAAPAAADDQLVRFLVLPARPLPKGGDAPRRDRVTAALGLALAAAVRVVDGVHRRAADGGALALPATPAGLAARDVLVVRVADLPD